MSEVYPEILPHYKSYGQTIQRTNILRYLLLHHYGGVYLDLDITCWALLDGHLHLPWLTPGAYPAGINNAFMLSKPWHPFLTELIERIPTHNLKWDLPYVENMLSTGCMFISNVWTQYMRYDSTHPPEDKLYILADEYGNLEGQMLRGAVSTSLFRHGGASSWHGWDAAGIIFVGEHYILALLLFAAGLAAWIWLILRLSRSRLCREPTAFEDEEVLWMKIG